VKTFDPFRREVLLGLAALNALPFPGSSIGFGTSQANPRVFYGQDMLPSGIRSRIVENNGSKMHILEAGFEERNRPCIVLLHGFPELAYTWRNQLLPLSKAGYHVIAPDLRGYGRSVTAAVRFDDDLLPYSLLNRVSDVVGLVNALGYRQVTAIVGHDWGAPTAAWSALIHPEIFRSVVLMSTPFDGPPDLKPGPHTDISKTLRKLPRPRKHYREYLATRGANDDMWQAPEGVHDLLRAQFHYKSADYQDNKPHPLKNWAASELAKLPDFYVMDLDKTVAQTMAEHMPSKEQIAACRWMTEQDLEVYAAEYTRTGFQGGLNYYRIFEVGHDLDAFAGRTITVPACFIAGKKDWGAYQSPGAFEAMLHGACSQFLGAHFVEGAGHSLAEEQPQRVNQILLDFLRRSNVPAV
jgi:pimeloyl-ACP methyl ester carboxylesterase